MLRFRTDTVIVCDNSIVVLQWARHFMVAGSIPDGVPVHLGLQHRRSTRRGRDPQTIQQTGSPALQVA